MRNLLLILPGRMKKIKHSQEPLFCEADELAAANNYPVLRISRAQIEFGITIYSIYPSEEMKPENLPLEPMMEWPEERIVLIKEIAPECSSYGTGKKKKYEDCHHFCRIRRWLSRRCADPAPSDICMDRS